MFGSSSGHKAELALSFVEKRARQWMELETRAAFGD
jgi:hypothetical protein